MAETTASSNVKTRSVITTKALSHSVRLAPLAT